MSDTKISELPAMAYANIASGDWLPVVNSDLNSTRKLDIANMGKMYTTVAAFFADTNYTPIDGTIVTAGPVQFQADSTANITGLRAGWVPFGEEAPQEAWGTDAAAIESASAYGDAVVTRDTTTTSRIDLTDGSDLSAWKDVTVTLASSGSTGPTYLLSAPNNATIQEVDFSLDADAAAISGANLLRASGAITNLTFEKTTADANITVNQTTGARNALSSFFTVSTGADVDGLRIERSTFKRFFWGLLQANSTVATFKNTTILSNRFDDHGSAYLVFNAPAAGAIYENTLVALNNMGAVTSRQPFDSGNPGFPHRGSFAGHVEYSRLIGNHMYGQGGAAFRAEEAAKASVWIGNTAKLDGKQGFQIIPNNVGGTIFSPTLFCIGDNVLENVGLSSSPVLEAGIDLNVFTGLSGHADAEALSESSVHDNVLAGWKWGMRLHQGAHRTLVHHNVTFGNTTSDVGVNTFAPSLAHHDNMITDHDTAIEFSRGGIMGNIHLRSTTDTPSPAAMTVTNGPGGVIGWTWETSRIGFTTGTTELELIEIGSAIDGQIVISVSDDDGTHDTKETGDLVYDGTDLVYYRRSRTTSGGTAVSSSAPIGIKNGHLTIAIFAATNSFNIRLQVGFTGLHTWS